MSNVSQREQKYKLEKFAEYKRARENYGNNRAWMEENLYDEISQEQYQSNVKARLQKDNQFVDEGADNQVFEEETLRTIISWTTASMDISTDNGMIDHDWNGEDAQRVESDKDVGETEKKSSENEKPITEVKAEAPSPASEASY
ncbi:hypothetical protein PLICRDRAFT_699852 [Plicaturopsis crispa FD-325 SS-3]|nr:hypothetical protein PLICRDRAFT_699852 [Plicaturopsis crispa FD-325 SS-3]